MLYITNRDRPGFIGALGTLLGDAGINIATFNLGRDKPGGDAIALVEVDQPADEAIVARIRALPQVIRCKTMRF
jgi:D-3-phosphoglycerate dehydrogenase